MIYIIKRDGRKQQFNRSKIERAVEKAFIAVDGEITDYDQSKVKSIADFIENKCTNDEKEYTVEEIQDLVENGLMSTKRKDVARAYILYRAERNRIRGNNIDSEIEELMNGDSEYWSSENSNKNEELSTTQRDYIAGIVSTDFSKRKILPEEVVKAHDEGIIHVHDMDYLIQHMHNCFTANTKFITDTGLKAFKDFNDGDSVYVEDLNGEFRLATVHKYGRQIMQKVTLSNGTITKDIICTPDHRWILEDGSVTTSLSVNDILVKNNTYNASWNKPWKVKNIEIYNNGEMEDAWCVEEPVTHSFTLESGIITGNCDLVNLEDMLQNGTVISGTFIETPHSFSTACNVATQIIAQVASAQYGGQSISLAALAPFVDVSRKKIRSEIEEDIKLSNISISDKDIDNIVERRLKKEIEKGVQTIQYQVVTLMTTNGQAPFITVFMYLDEVEEGQIRDDLALIIEETLRQRIRGVKNEKGAWITPAFPKLIYCLDEDNIYEDSKYYYLTKLAAQCSAKRLVPDYISAKVMKELKGGDVYTCMGCVDGEEIITYKFNENLYVEGFSRMWAKMSMLFPVKEQYDIPNNPNLYIDLQNVEIYDTKIGSFTPCYRLIRNVSNKWMDVTISNGRRLLCTEDHPFEILNRGVIYAKNLIPGDKVLTSRYQYSENNFNIDPELAWTLGVIICDGSYSNSITVSIAAKGEDEIASRYIENMQKFFNIGTEVKLRERGIKGTYKDIVSRKELSSENAIKETKKYLNDIFEGEQKIYRHFPANLFSWNYYSKLAFLAGMIDADGYINSSQKPIVVQLGSTNKELALQQMALAQALGMTARLYYNHYSSQYPEKIRYRIEFEANPDLIQFISCQKKVNNYSKNSVSFADNNHLNYLDPISEIVSIRPIFETRFSYDVTTQSEHFEVSGIYSHNCRSFLTPDRFTDAGIGNIANAKNYIEGKHKYYGRLA